MKQLIVLVASIMLGVFIVGLIAGPGEGSVYSDVKQLWQEEIHVRTMNDQGGVK